MAFTQLFLETFGEASTAFSFMDKLIDELPAPTGFVDSEGQLLAANRAWLKLFLAVDRGQILQLLTQTQGCGQSAGQLLSQAVQPTEQVEHLSTVLTLTIEGGEYQFRIGFAAVAPGLFSAHAERVSGNLHELQDLLQNEMEMHRSKRSFLAYMSHEMLRPISAILGISQIELQKPSLDPNLFNAFERVHRASQELHKITNDLLDLSKIEAHTLQLLTEPYRLEHLLQDVLAKKQSYSDDPQLQFNIEIDPGLPAVLKGDRLRVEQILSNLLSNAFNYTDQGSVTLTVRADSVEHPSGERYVGLQLMVTDTGIGMLPEHVENIFNTFARFHENNHRHTSGIGLGMPIVHSLCQLMEASIDITSAVNQGTTVTIVIPQQVTGRERLGRSVVDQLCQVYASHNDTNSRGGFSIKSLKGHKVLVVDDVETNLYVVRGLLSFYQLDIETCQSGHEALEKIKAGQTYDIVFMDHLMPILDGVETLHTLRQAGYTKPVVVLTANDMIGQAEKFIKIGFDAFLAKPIQTHHLNAVLSKFIHSNEAEVLAPSTAGFLDDPAVIQQLHLDFVKQHIETIEHIRKFIQKKDLVSARRFAHNLKSAAGLIGEQVLAGLAGDIENELAAQQVPLTQVLNRTADVARQVVVNIVTQKQLPVSVSTKEKLTRDNSHVLFSTLRPLLKSHNVSVLKHCKALEKLAGTETLLHHINEFQFTQALEELLKLQAKAE